MQQTLRDCAFPGRGEGALLDEKPALLNRTNPGGIQTFSEGIPPLVQPGYALTGTLKEHCWITLSTARACLVVHD
jgi:hypothetical protein